MYRRISAVLIALCLCLPLRQCTVDGKTEVFYPLSGDTQGMLIMGAIYLLPLLTVVLARRNIAAMVVGLLACFAGLYCVGFLTMAWSSKVLIGWYAYLTTSIAYIIFTGAELRRGLMAWRAVRASRALQS